MNHHHNDTIGTMFHQSMTSVRQEAGDRIDDLVEKLEASNVTILDVLEHKTEKAGKEKRDFTAAEQRQFDAGKTQVKESASNPFLQLQPSRHRYSSHIWSQPI